MYLCPYFTRNHEEQSLIRRIQKTSIRRTAFGLHPYHFTYSKRRLTMEEMVYNIINEGKREHEEMRAFIKEFRTSNELLFKERNNSLSELRFEVHGLSKGRDDEVIFDVDQSIKRTSADDDECYRIDNLDDTINVETQELLGNDQLDSFLLKVMEKSINQLDLESCNSIENESRGNSDIGIPIQRIDSVNTPYSEVHKTVGTDEHLYSTSANEIDEKKPELKDLANHLEYA
ncbi:hypothetical protein Tco_0952787 [Tanacetum coccineum]|uniref:Uncharacterized protein n=1 Tax=Tanacetum coccineum TaxID=301880 RepID=A0ABQ5E0B4_9ASTR